MKAKDTGNPSNKKKIILRGILFGLLILGMLFLTFQAIPWMQMLTDESSRAQFEAWIDGLGVGGWFVLLAIQVGQIVVAFIPGEPVEVLSGVLYGTVGGLLTCELGILIGTISVFYAVKQFGRPFVNLFISADELKSYRFLNDSNRLEALTFLLFFIPGTPKDALTYLMPLTPIKPLKFFLISMIARIPSVVSSTWAGATLSTGNIWGTVLIFVGIGAIALLGILFQRKFMGKVAQTKPDSGKS